MSEGEKTTSAQVAADSSIEEVKTQIIENDMSLSESQKQAQNEFKASQVSEISV